MKILGYKLNCMFSVHFFQAPDVWPLDSTEPSKWEENVDRIAYAVLDARLKGENPSGDLVQPLPRTTTAPPPLPERNSFYCTDCERLIEGAHIEVHLKSAKHAKAVERKKRLSMIHPKEEPVASVGPDFESSWSKSPTWSDRGWGSDVEEDFKESRRDNESSDEIGVSLQSNYSNQGEDEETQMLSKK